MIGSHRRFAAKAGGGVPLVVGVLLLMAVVVLGVGYVKQVTIDHRDRGTNRVAATVLRVNTTGIAEVRYQLGGKTHIGQLSLSGVTGIDSGDRVVIRAAGGLLHPEMPFHVALYKFTAAALAVLAGLVIAGKLRSSRIRAGSSRPWLPAELRRPR